MKEPAGYHQSVMYQKNIRRNIVKSMLPQFVFLALDPEKTANPNDRAPHNTHEFDHWPGGT